MSIKNGNGDPNKALMIARGSKTGAYDCDAPDQWKFTLRHGEGEARALAWVQSKTIAINHKSPYCVDEHGKPVTAKHMAVELGWEISTAKKYLWRLASQGRVRIETGKRVWYCAEVPYAYTDLPDDLGGPLELEKEGRTEGEKKFPVQDTWSTYIVDFIENMPLLQQGAAKATLNALETWKKDFFADGMIALRAIAERVEDTTFRKIGIPKKRLPKRKPAEECKWIQLSLLTEPDFVQSSASGLVRNGENPVQTEKGAVQSAREDTSSLVYSSITTTTSKTSTRAARVDGRPPFSPDLYKQANNPPPLPLSSIPAPATAEEEECQSLSETFKRSYPRDHFDEGKAIEIFDLKTKPEQRRILERLEVYLSCPRWQDDDGRWIPLASNWLRTCEAEPPPPLKKGNGKGPTWEERDAEIRAALAAEDAIAAKGGHR